LCEAFTTDEDTDMYVGYGRELGSGVVGEVAANGEALLLDDVRESDNYVRTMPGSLSELCVPIKYGGLVVAILDLESKRLAAFRGLLPLLETIAEQVGGAIAGARLYEALRQQAEFTEMLAEVSRMALEVDDLPAVLNRITSFLADRFELSIAVVLLLDEDATHFVEVAFSGNLEMSPPEEAGKWPVSKGVCGLCVRSGEPQLVGNVKHDPNYWQGHEEIRSEYCVPIRHRDRILGVLNAESKEENAFSLQEQRTLQAIADQVAGVIQLARVNQRLLESNQSVEEKTRQLEEANNSLERANVELERLSMIDSLTGIANRRRFDQVLDLEWRRACRVGQPLSLMLVDIDHFKALNDTHGHPYGDDCLRLVAGSLEAGLMRASDFVARYGGEEFGLVCPDTKRHRASELAEALRQQVRKLNIENAGCPDRPFLTISIGVATMRPDLEAVWGELVEEADKALYQAKDRGRNLVVVADLKAEVEQ
jgi:diguanylate cyclase (GGDEF)-like protein